MLARVDSIRYTGGSTNTADLLRTVSESMFRQAAGDRRNARNVLLLVTDGSSNDRQATLRAARQAKAAGVHVLVVIVGNWYNKHEISAIASYPNERNLFHIDRFDQFDSRLRSQLMNLMCNSTYSRAQTRAVPKPFDNKPSHSMCCHLAIGAVTKILPIQ